METGENYPDITLLPSIASFFDVSVDSLLGVDNARKEDEILVAIEDYNKLKNSGKTDLAKEKIKKAVEKFPSEFRLIVRLMEAIVIEENTSDEGAVSALTKIKPLYYNIQNYCTDDSIRIWAKRLMLTVFKRLSVSKNNSVTSSDFFNLLEQMPSVYDSKEYISTYLLQPSDEHDYACRNAVDTLTYLLNGAIINYCYYDDRFTSEFKIKIMESQENIMKVLYPDEDYGINYVQAVYRLGHLGYIYAEVGNNNKALEYLKRSVTLAKKYDALPDKSIRTSPLFENSVFAKDSTPQTTSSSLYEKMKTLITERYTLSKDFKSSEAFGDLFNDED